MTPKLAMQGLERDPDDYQWGIFYNRLDIGINNVSIVPDGMQDDLTIDRDCWINLEYETRVENVRDEFMALKQENIALQRSALLKAALDKDLSQSVLSEMSKAMTRSGTPEQTEQQEAAAAKMREIITSSKTDQEMMERIRQINP